MTVDFVYLPSGLSHSGHFSKLTAKIDELSNEQNFALNQDPIFRPFLKEIWFVFCIFPFSEKIESG